MFSQLLCGFLCRRFEFCYTFDCVFSCWPVTGTIARREKEEDDRLKLAGSVDPLVCQDNTRADIAFATNKTEMQVGSPTEVGDAPSCKEKCSKAPGCKYWSFNESRFCNLLKNYTTRSFSKGHSSGDILCKCNMLITVVQDLLTIVLVI